MSEIRFIESESDVRDSYLVMKQLRPHLTEQEYLDSVLMMRVKDGYLLAGLYDSEELASLAGFRLDHLASDL